jgi:hypothetical protein
MIYAPPFDDPIRRYFGIDRSALTAAATVKASPADDRNRLANPSPASSAAAPVAKSRSSGVGSAPANAKGSKNLLTKAITWLSIVISSEINIRTSVVGDTATVGRVGEGA